MIHAQYYHTIFIYLILLYTLFQTSAITSFGRRRLIYAPKNSGLTLVFCVILSLFLATRPISGRYFGDTVTYAFLFSKYSYYNELPYDADVEVGFSTLMYLCTKMGDVAFFFFVTGCIFFLFQYWACKRLITNNATWAMMFVLGAYTCWGSAVNGLRNGVACAILWVAYSYLQERKKKIVVPILLALLAYSMHKSTILPILCTVFALYYSNTKNIIRFWLLSIVISFVGGSAVANVFVGLGFDDRLDSYIVGDDAFKGYFSSTGFRFDFLLYSAVPIVLGYYVVVKRKIYDFHYKLLLNTYILANSFWVMVITSSFSNRFAYLSWFLYPLLLAYPLLKFEIWSNQSKKVAIFMLGNILFTYFMFLIGK